MGSNEIEESGGGGGVGGGGGGKVDVVGVEGEEGEPFSEFGVRGVQGDVSTTDKSFNVSVINDAMFAIERPALRVRASVVCAMRGWVVL
jgi:hypothetical protein